jgi:ABC-type dipeptide/oligopeptide/nickel transport system permease subunit
MTTTVVVATMALAQFIIAEARLSFLALGVDGDQFRVRDRATIRSSRAS